MKKLFKLLKIIDDNLLVGLLTFFIFFIPLYPKFPLKIVNYTYVAIRAEDFFMVFFVFIFLVQVIRRKIKLNRQLLWAFLIFWLMVFSAYIYGAYISRTIEFPHLGFLHSARRVEYMIVFFIAASSIKSKKQFQIILFSLIISLLIVNLYGLGQRFLNFPAVQTMNAEFARGHLLYLTPEARLSSTFAGHYDLASYLVFLIPIVMGIFLSIKNKSKYLILLVILLSIVILALTVSRISFFAYLISITFFLIISRKFKYFIFIVLFTALTIYLTGDLMTRFKKTFQLKQILVNEKTGEVFIPQKITTKELPAGSTYIELKKPAPELIKTPKDIKKFGTETALLKDFKKQVAQEKVTKDILRTKKLLTASEEAKLVASISAFLKAMPSIVADISFSTRLQVEWPRAIIAFLNNPFLGTGPSSLTEATDNDYLRWLGEFGFLGFAAFLYVLFKILQFIIVNAKKANHSNKTLFYGLVFSIIGILINAIYIDVFEASKVAFVFWALVAMLLRSIQLSKHSKIV